MRNWVDLVFEVGPMGTLAAGGAVALARGLIPMFDLKPALFGASLLFAAALVELFVWLVKRRSAEREVERAFIIRTQALQKYDQALRLRQEIDKGAPSAKKVESSELVD